jgi:hypothetical protein
MYTGNREILSGPPYAYTLLILQGQASSKRKDKSSTNVWDLYPAAACIDYKSDIGPDVKDSEDHSIAVLHWYIRVLRPFLAVAILIIVLYTWTSQNNRSSKEHILAPYHGLSDNYHGMVHQGMC